MSRSLSKQVDYLVIGGLGSIEWNPRSLGTKIDLAMYYRKIKVPIWVIKESALREALEPLRLTPRRRSGNGGLALRL